MVVSRDWWSPVSLIPRSVEFGSIRVKCGSSMRQERAKCGSNTGRVRDKYGSSAGQVHVKVRV